MPIAMDKSKEEPSFLMSAGARFTVIFLVGKVKDEFLMAELTLSLASFTATSGRPTILNLGSPLARSTSTSTGYASIPKRALE